uniref:C2H2-type domain-containing protein n=1 Tax=Anopheles farauti TaxID=69004 RepID=A0A182Q9H8_9DIPT
MIIEERDREMLSQKVIPNDLSAIYSAPQSVSVVYGMAVSHSSYRSDISMGHTSNTMFDSQERIALKYPRKKITSPGDSNAHTIPHASNNPLYKRRHEIFPQTICATTYAEHRQLKAMAEKNKEAEAIGAVCNPRHLNPDSSLPSINNTNTMTHNNEKQRQEPPYADISSSENENRESSDSTAIVGYHEQQLSRSSADVSENITEPNVCASGSVENGKNVESCEKSKKPTKQKPRGNSRELHDLLSYTIEIMPKIDSQKRKTARTSSDSSTDELLKIYGINKDVRIILERIDPSKQYVAQRTRSKSIDCSKYLNNTAPEALNTSSQNKTKPRNHSKSNDKLSAHTKSRNTVRKTAPKPASKKRTEKSNTQKGECERPTTCNREDSNPTGKENKSKKSSSASKKRMRQSSESRSSSSPKRTRINSSSNNQDSDSACVVPTTLPAAIKHSDSSLVNAGKNMEPKPNNDLTVHCDSVYMQQCCLCEFEGGNIVDHYVYQHSKGPVYVSRLLPEQADIIRLDPLAVTGRKIASRFFGSKPSIMFCCYFCNLRINTHTEEWLVHISSHTGEYRYKCISCPTIARTEHSDVPHHVDCYGPSIELWEDFNLKDNHLYGYMCNKCNFVQIKYENIMRHIRNDHVEADAGSVTHMQFSLFNYSTADECSGNGEIKLEPIFNDSTHKVTLETVERDLEGECSLFQDECDGGQNEPVVNCNIVPKQEAPDYDEYDETDQNRPDLYLTNENSAEQIVSSNWVVLKPWVTSSCDYAKVREHKFTIDFIQSLYKCIVLDCGYHTKNPESIQHHLKSHQHQALTTRAVRGASPWLECSYCNHVAASVPNLLKHIDEIHRFCAFLCNLCCYRSRDPTSLLEHQKLYHTKEPEANKAYYIVQRYKPYSHIDRDSIVNEMNNTVKILKCSICPLGIFHKLAEYEAHMKSHGLGYVECFICDQLIPSQRLLDHLKLHNIYMHQCVYCNFGNDEVSVIRKHVIDEHSCKMLCYHVRKSPVQISPFVRVIEKISPQRVIRCSDSC